MAPVINKLMLGGVRLINHAVLRFTRNGKPYARFAVAVEEGWKGKKQPSLLNCILWGDNARLLAPLLVRDGKITLEGRLSFNRRQDNDGQEYNNPEMVVQTILLPEQRHRPQQQPHRPPHHPRPLTAGSSALKPAAMALDELPPF